MPFPDLSDIVTATLKAHSAEIADGLALNNTIIERMWLTARYNNMTLRETISDVLDWELLKKSGVFDNYK
jgi:hypothetical protein